jgi:hypothetical protein
LLLAGAQHQVGLNGNRIGLRHNEAATDKYQQGDQKSKSTYQIIERQRYH